MGEFYNVLYILAHIFQVHLQVRLLNPLDILFGFQETSPLGPQDKVAVLHLTGERGPLLKGPALTFSGLVV